MKRIALAVVVLLSVAGRARAGDHRFLDYDLEICHHPELAPQVDLYTFGVGPEVFEKFGHGALCVTYDSLRPPNNRSICFNYGVTNFEEPGKLVWGFMRSKQKFWVQPEYLSSMKAFYTSEDRDIFQQRLPLTDDQAKQIAAKLCSDIKPENRYYIYHHFKDNCTTRLRDMIDNATGGMLKADSDERVPLSFRGYGRRGMSEYTALIGVSDFITGRNLDYYPTQWEAMFHPEELREQVALKLGVEPVAVNTRKGPPFPTSGPTGRWVVVLISILLTAPLVLVRWRGWKRERLAVALASVPLILFGIALWLIFVFVTIDWVRWNEVMVMYVPTDLALLFLGPARRRRYAQIRVAMVALASALAAIGVFRQPIWVPAFVAFLPLSVLAFDLPPAKVRVEAVAPSEPKAKPKTKKSASSRPARAS